MTGLGPLPFSLFANPHAGTPGMVTLPAGGFRRARRTITAWPGYAPTVLRDLPEIAATCGIAAVRIKHERGRFGLGGFQALSGGYGVGEAVATELARSGVAANADAADLISGRYAEAAAKLTVTCAANGGHGVAVAWAAATFGCSCVVFLSRAAVAGEGEKLAAEIARHGGQLRNLDETYDATVRHTNAVAAKEGWLVVPDTSWEGAPGVAVDVMQGMRLMADEAVDQWVALSPDAPPTHVFVQTGAGGVPAAISAQMRMRLSPSPALVVVEPARAACLLASAQQGALTEMAGELATVMTELSCGEPNLLAWAELERGAAAFLAIPDEAAAFCAALLSAGGIEASASGSAGLAGLLLAARDPAARATLGLDSASRVLLFNTG